MKNKIVAITGASSGIGKSCAEKFAAAGANLILIARRAEKLKQLSDDLIEKFQIKTLQIILDVSDLGAIEQAFSDLPAVWQDIDVLVNNAGMAIGRDSFQVTELNAIDRMIDTNIKGVMYVTKKVLPGMLARNKGHLINIGSIAGHETYAGGSIYCATKFAIGALSDGLKKDLLGTAIRVTLISPGMVKTEFSEVRFGDHEKAESIYAGMVPLIAEDVADTVLFAATRPVHVNISEILVLPVDQASVGMVNRK